MSRIRFMRFKLSISYDSYQSDSTPHTRPKCSFGWSLFELNEWCVHKYLLSESCFFINMSRVSRVTVTSLELLNNTSSLLQLDFQAVTDLRFVASSANTCTCTLGLIRSFLFVTRPRHGTKLHLKAKPNFHLHVLKCKCTKFLTLIKITKINKQHKCTNLTPYNHSCDCAITTYM